jgi:replicative DNA helicase
LITRLISSETGLSSEKLRTGKLEKHEWEQLSIKVKNLEKAPLYIDDTPSLSIFDLRAKARRLASQHGIKMIVVDYLQLMTAGGNGKGGACCATCNGLDSRSAGNPKRKRPTKPIH